MKLTAPLARVFRPLSSLMTQRGFPADFDQQKNWVNEGDAGLSQMLWAFIRSLASRNRGLSSRLTLTVCALTVALSAGRMDAGDSLAADFLNPPNSAKPIIIWQWMNGVVSRDGITADLEAFKRAGLGGVQNFQVGGPMQALADNPSVQIGNEKWRGLMRFAMDECTRLGLSFGTHNCPGWSSSGAPDVKVEDSMQKLVWTEMKVAGPAKVVAKPERPQVDPRWNYYRDIVVLALPDQPEVPLESVIDLTAQLNAKGELRWEAPAGKWIILRFGHTTNGVMNGNNAPLSGVGLECDKLSRHALERYWAGYPSMLLDLAGKNAGRSFSRIEIDSYEPGPQDWTPAMLAEFKARRGYDLLPWLPTLAKKTIGSETLTKRFSHDWRRTIGDLFADNYYLAMDELARRTPGMNLLVQPYGGPFDIHAVSGGQSLLCAEFWTRPDWGWSSVSPVTSAAHTLGKPLVYGEGFTCWPLSAWQDDPASLKPVGDRAFSEGVNTVMLHAGAQNPWPNVKPGMTFGKWGTQFTPGQTWWEHGGVEWFAYLARCQAMLQRGLFVGDLAYLVDGFTKAARSHPTGYTGDECGERAFLTRMSVKDGELVMPDGMSYRVLVLPDSQSMSLPVARKLHELVQQGAVIVGPKPVASPGLENYPAADSEIKRIGEEVWADTDGNTVKEHRYGKGRVYWGKSPEEVLRDIEVQPDVQFGEPGDLRWIHRREGTVDLYFISNQKAQTIEVTASFRVTGRLPELWRADTGQMQPVPHWRKDEQRTDVLLNLDPGGSIFVVFRQAIDGSGPGLQKSPPGKKDILEVGGSWELRFPAGWGAPDNILLDQLASWTENQNAGVKYFSGTATYSRNIEVPATWISPTAEIILDLGIVKNIAEVFVNGEQCGLLWKPPFRTNIVRALKPGQNRLEIRVTNLWCNRMIGDEHEPDDTEWGEPFKYVYAPGEPIIGRFLARVPQWLAEGKPRPSRGRYTLSSFKFFTKDSPLLPSGLLGPVKLEGPHASPLPQ